jgi:hypothetical protein
MTETERNESELCWWTGMRPNHILGEIGMRPVAKNDSVSFRFCSTRDSVSFRGPKNVWSHSNFAQNVIRSHSNWSFGLSHSVLLFPAPSPICLLKNNVFF